MVTGSLTVWDADAKSATKTTKRRSSSKKPAKQAVTKSASTANARTTAAKTPKKATPKARPKTKSTRSAKNSHASRSKVKKTTNSAQSKTKAVRSSAASASQNASTHVKRQPLGHLFVEKLLREKGFQGGVSSSKEILDQYSTDESIFSIRPQIVLQPQSQKDVEIAVAVLGNETKRFPSLSLTPRAAGTGLSGGSLTDSIIIDVCAHMHEIGEIKTSKKTGSTITVGPGAMWRDVEKKLKKTGLYLPSYPASKDICSIGGAIANNAAGPDSLRYGHCANWVASLDITLYDGHTYTLKPITYKEYKALTKKDNALARILKEVLALVEKNEKAIQAARPKTKKNTAGYALWDVIDGTVAGFKKGNAKLDLTRLVSGSQGTVGVITAITLKTEPINTNTELIVVPVFDLEDAGRVVIKALEYDPINIELFDGLTFDLALANPNFFKQRLEGFTYYRVLLSMYTLYHVRYRRQTPAFTLLITIDRTHLKKATTEAVVTALKQLSKKRARLVTKDVEKEMFWQIRRASYTLSKFQDPEKRPAAFLEDMTVPPKNLPKFFTDIKKLLKQYNVTAAVHGHGGNGHLHFYPLLDFTNKTTPQLVEKMTEEFFNVAVKYDGNICGEHNDGIIRTPHLSKIFPKKVLNLFAKVEHVFDPDDIFNPGKKVNPRFDITSAIRRHN